MTTGNELLVPVGPPDPQPIQAERIVPRKTGELDSFVQFASHDLQIPLRFMRRIAERLLELHGDGLPGEVVDGIAAILSSAEQVEGLVGELLLYARAGNTPVVGQWVDLNLLAKESFDGLEAEMGNRDVRLRIEALPLAHGDRVMLKQLFSNLLSNAVKFTSSRKTAAIHIGVKRVNGETVYFVRDNGVGFDQGKAGALFLPFKRLENANGTQGSGIGLALVKRIIEQHRGRIWAEGRVNWGATFFFVLNA